MLFSLPEIFFNFLSFFSFELNYFRKRRVVKRQRYNPIRKAEFFIICCKNLFFGTVVLIISPFTTVSPDTFLVSSGGFLNVSKFTRDVILLLKFSKPRPVDPFFIPLCFLFNVLSRNNSKYSLEF